MTFTHKFATFATLGLLVLGASHLHAQGADFGGKLTASEPGGDMGNSTFLNHQVGLGWGLHLAIGVPGGTLVPRVDYTSYQNDGNGQAKARMLQAGVDYDLYLRTEDHTGPYLGLGAGYGSTKFQQASPNISDTPNNIFYAVQVGYMFTHFAGTELRYTYAEYKNNFSGPVPNWTAPTLNLSLILQF